MRVVLDTNVVMSAIFFGGTPRKIVRAAFSKKVDLVAAKNFHRPLSILESKLTMVRPATLREAVCRDPDDDDIIACALGGKAKVICSGDGDLLDLDGFRGLEIMKPSDFCQRMGLK